MFWLMTLAGATLIGFTVDGLWEALAVIVGAGLLIWAQDFDI